jgi:Na+/H+-dicarboxylate symporter
MKKLALHWQILLGMVFGVLFAFILIQFTWGKDVIVDWVKPFGTIFINLLKLIAVPLILASLIKGISDLKDISKLSKMGGRTIGLYILTTVIAVSIGLVIVNIIKPGSFISEQTRTELVSSYTADANSKIEAANKQSEVGPLQSLIDIVPDNIVKASADNGNMLQVIFFAVIFGIAMILLPEDKSKPVKDFFDSFNEIILKMIDIIMLFSPIGVFALLAAIVAESPSLDLFKALGMYGLTVIIGLILVMSFYFFMVFCNVSGFKYGFFAFFLHIGQKVFPHSF